MKKNLLDYFLYCIAIVMILVFINNLFGVNTGIKSIFKIIVAIAVFIYFIYEKTKNVINLVHPKYLGFINPINRNFNSFFRTLNKFIGNISIGPNLSIETSHLLFLLFALTLLYIL